MRPFFRKTAHDSHHVNWRRLHPDPHLEPEASQRHGHVTTVKVKGVCKRCNETWMSRMEGRVSPFFKLMLNGDPVSLDETLQMYLAEWVALKMMVMQRVKNAREVIERETCARFREDRLPNPLPPERSFPPSFRAWIFHAPDPRNASIQRRDVSVMTNDDTAPSFRPPFANTQAILLGAGPVLIYATQTSIPENELNIEHDPSWGIRIWPIENAAALWPPASALSFEDVINIRDIFTRFMATKTPV